MRQQWNRQTKLPASLYISCTVVAIFLQNAKMLLQVEMLTECIFAEFVVADYYHIRRLQ